MPDAVALESLVGVYDADGSVLGELRYWVGARLGRTHCSLCDITHGLVREKEEWQGFCDQLPVPFSTVHRDAMPDDVSVAVAEAGGELPVVVARAAGRTQVVLGSDALASAGGEPEALGDLLGPALAGAGLRWP